ncbi:MAG: Xaa-Pro aminopeptidase [Erysipelotrichaceae bacterium]|nr:Xaa-Pro aminopeptidase [Erysipelotrichaceae bacterium]
MNIYKQRRAKLMDTLNNTTVVLFSGMAPLKSEDEFYPFEVNRNFYYLTGLTNESMALVLNKKGNVLKEKLFILPFDEKLAKWVGGRMLKEEAIALTEVDEVGNYEEIEDFIESLSNSEDTVYFDLWTNEDAKDNNIGVDFAYALKENNPELDIDDIYPLIAKMRMKKDETEVEEVKKAIAITKKGVEAMMKNIRPGIVEMAMEGLFNYELAKENCSLNAFKSICASGKRATILHYSSNNSLMEDGELFLCDLGATSNKYCADISRTFPVNGKFTDRQKEIYEIVLKAQQLVIDNARPGLSTVDLNKIVVDFYKEELPKHGLNKDVREYYYHGVSHQLGLDTHDVTLDRKAPLEAGNIITDEPGLYIEDENIGIRIEDDLLITEDGCIVLSSDIPKTVEEIEELAAR